MHLVRQQFPGTRGRAGTGRLPVLGNRFRFCCSRSHSFFIVLRIVHHFVGSNNKHPYQNTIHMNNHGPACTVDIYTRYLGYVTRKSLTWSPELISRNISSMSQKLLMKTSRARTTQVCVICRFDLFSPKFMNVCKTDSDQTWSTQDKPSQPSGGESNFGDSSGPLFSIYSKAAEDEDSKMVDRWQKDADGILFFVSPRVAIRLYLHTSGGPCCARAQLAEPSPAEQS